ncbi:MAG: FkbM family methyltransferase [Deltaproteobacteria bacterium]|nr:FkbM family methyltransferase [Deltaproteobacteria bacterium]
MNKAKMALQHLGPILRGFPRFFLESPLFACRLFVLRLGYFLTHRQLFPLKDPTGFPIDNSHLLISYWAFFVERESQRHPWVEDFRQAASPLALDVGANGGVFSHLLITLNPRVRLYLFEPLPAMAERLFRWQSRIEEDLTVWGAACGAIPGEKTLYFSHPGDTDARIGPQGPNLEPPEEMKENSAIVPMVTLDSTVPDADIFLMKVDAQGSELSVLRGGQKAVANSRYLLLELATSKELSAARRELGPDWCCDKVSRADYLFYRRTTGR